MWSNGSMLLMKCVYFLGSFQLQVRSGANAQGVFQSHPRRSRCGTVVEKVDLQNHQSNGRSGTRVLQVAQFPGTTRVTFRPFRAKRGTNGASAGTNGRALVLIGTALAPNLAQRIGDCFKMVFSGSPETRTALKTLDIVIVVTGRFQFLQNAELGEQWIATKYQSIIQWLPDLSGSKCFVLTASPNFCVSSQQVTSSKSAPVQYYLLPFTLWHVFVSSHCKLCCVHAPVYIHKTHILHCIYILVYYFYSKVIFLLVVEYERENVIGKWLFLVCARQQSGGFLGIQAQEMSRFLVTQAKGAAFFQFVCKTTRKNKCDAFKPQTTDYFCKCCGWILSRYAAFLFPEKVDTPLGFWPGYGRLNVFLWYFSEILRLVALFISFACLLNIGGNTYF